MARTPSKRGTGSAERRKRSSRRKHKHTVAGGSKSARHSPLGSFASLPHEIRTHIIDLACSPATPSSSSPPSSPRKSEASCNDSTSPETQQPSSPRRRPRLDFTTTLSLVLTSKSFYALMVPTLYSHVWISRPSALASFHLAISARPQLGAFVKSLHVGPDSQLPIWWDPIVETGGCDCGECEPPRRYMRTSLRAQDEVELLPSWCSPEKLWPLDYDGSDAKLKAANKALRTACQVIDIDLDLGSYLLSAAGKVVSSIEYTMRQWEVQGALELYFVAVRRWEDEQSSGDSCPNAYPRLVLTGYSRRPTSRDRFSAAEEPQLVVSRSDLLRHLARPHCATDRFDHPLVFARSGMETSTPASSSAYESVRHSRSDVPASEALFCPAASPLDPSLPNTATIQSLINMLRSILAQTHQLQNISLTGFLDLAISEGYPTTLVLNSVRSACLGPPPPGWLQPLGLDALAGCEELRIAGMRLDDRELAQLMWEMPDARRLQLSMPASHGDHSPSLLQIIDNLRCVGNAFKEDEAAVGAGGVAVANEGRGEDSNERSSSAASSSSSDSSNEESTVPILEARLHPLDVKKLLDMAPSAEVREAWTTGRALPNQRRRLLLAPPRIETRDELYEEGRQWWEDHAEGWRSSWIG